MQPPRHTGLTFRQHAQRLVRRVPTDPRRLPAGRMLTGHVGALGGQAGPLASRRRHGLPLDLLPGGPKLQAAARPAVEGQGQEKPLGRIQYPLGGRRERTGRSALRSGNKSIRSAARTPAGLPRGEGSHWAGLRPAGQTLALSRAPSREPENRGGGGGDWEEEGDRGQGRRRRQGTGREGVPCTSYPCCAFLPVSSHTLVCGCN